MVIAGCLVSKSASQSNFIILLGTGVGVMGFASIFFPIGWCIIRMRRTTQMRKAIAEESKKYSTRSPTSCTWRLNVTTMRTGYSSRNVIYFYRVSSTVTSYISYKLLCKEKYYRKRAIFFTCLFVTSILFISGGNYYSSYCCTKGKCKNTWQYTSSTISWSNFNILFTMR